MKNITRFKILLFLLVEIYFLCICGRTLPQSKTSLNALKVQANIVAFTRIIEAMISSQWIVSGQQMFSVNGAVVALKVESSASVIPCKMLENGVH